MNHFEELLLSKNYQIVEIEDTEIIGCRLKEIPVDQATNCYCCFGGIQNDTPILSKTQSTSCCRSYRWYLCEGIEVIILCILLVLPCLFLFTVLLNTQFQWAYLTNSPNAFSYRHFDKNIQFIIDIYIYLITQLYVICDRK